ncbi:MAG: hypothetical protein VYD64_11590 [Pseudomonadota bacterium]|nr:hypothetical protein [Pseudomonadota bacterium]
MSIQQSLPASGGEPAAAFVRPSALADLVSTLSIIALIWTEIWLAAAATIWAGALFIGNGPAGYVILAIPVVPAAIWASWHTLRLAWLSARAGQTDAT